MNNYSEIEAMFMVMPAALSGFTCKCCGAIVNRAYINFHYDWHKTHGDEQRVR
jgi:transcription initiation factor TFIIIB Brf1 subunit/transcription initiation factor TFIIB